MAVTVNILTKDAGSTVAAETSVEQEMVKVQVVADVTARARVPVPRMMSP